MSTRSSRLQALQQALKERILILDGGMGTMIQSYKLEEEELPRRALRRLAAGRQRQQ